MEYNFLSKDGLLYVWQKIKTLLGEKVDKKPGYDLSQNDLTDELLEKINNSSEGVTDYNSLTGLPTLDGTEIKGELTKEGLKIASTDEVNKRTVQKVEGGKGTSLVSNDPTGGLLKFTTNDGKESGVAVNDGSENIYAQLYAKTTADNNGARVTLGIDKAYYTVGSSISFTEEDEIINKKALSGYVTESLSSYTDTEGMNSAIQDAIGGVTQFDQQIVQDLPESGKKGTIYLKANSGEEQNTYDEYIWLDGQWEKIGTTAIDLSGYVQTEDLVEISNQEIDEIFNK